MANKEEPKTSSRLSDNQTIEGGTQTFEGAGEGSPIWTTDNKEKDDTCWNSNLRRAALGHPTVRAPESCKMPRRAIALNSGGIVFRFYLQPSSFRCTITTLRKRNHSWSWSSNSIWKRKIYKITSINSTQGDTFAFKNTVYSINLKWI